MALGLVQGTYSRVSNEILNYLASSVPVSERLVVAPHLVKLAEKFAAEARRKTGDQDR